MLFTKLIVCSWSEINNCSCKERKKPKRDYCLMSSLNALLYLLEHNSDVSTVFVVLKSTKVYRCEQMTSLPDEFWKDNIEQLLNIALNISQHDSIHEWMSKFYMSFCSPIFRAAAQKAGFDVLRCISEHAAGALAYDLGQTSPKQIRWANLLRCWNCDWLLLS